MFLGKKDIRQMAIVAAAALVLGLGANFFYKEPLPRPEDAHPAFGEVDADFVLQSGITPGILLLDARPGEAFLQGHIPGALSLPLGEFATAFPRLEAKLRQAQWLVVYCSDRNCGDSPELARLLWEQGMKNLLLYKAGMEDWRGKGHAEEQ